MKAEDKNGAAKYSISMVDLHTNNISSIVPTKIPYQYLYLDGTSVLLVDGKRAMILGQRIRKLLVEEESIQPFIKTANYYPSVTFRFSDKYYVLLGGNDSGPLWLEVFDNNGVPHRVLELDSCAMSTSRSNYIDRKKGRMLLLTNDFHNTGVEGDTSLIDVDLKRMTVKKQDHNFREYFLAVNSFSIDDKNNKAYIAPSVKKHQNEYITNDSIFVFSLPDYKLLETIQVNGQPIDQCLVTENNKLYVNDGINVSVINTNSNKLISSYPLHAIRMEYCGNSKLLLSTSKVNNEIDPKTGGIRAVGVDHKLLILDTNTDKIIMEYSGLYGPISRKQ